MSKAAELVAQLATAGIAPELLAAVAQELFLGEKASQEMEQRREAERENSRRYRSRLGKEIPGALRREVFERDGYRCVDCGAEDRLECDHIVPLMAGGTSDFDNLQTLCKPCNARKRDRVRKSDKRGQSRTNSEASEEHGQGQTPALDKEIPQTPKETKPNPTPPYNPPASRRGTRLAADFDPPEDWIDWAMAKRGWSRGDAIDECECFIRYWQSKPGRDACKLDWPKTWQNWAVNSRRRSDVRAQPAVPL